MLTSHRGMRMRETQIEYPAYNIFFRQGGNWMLHDSPIIGKPYEEVYNIATGILFWSKRTEAVRIYGVFNCQQTFIQEMSKKNFPKPESNEDRMRSAIHDAIAICDEAMLKGCFVRDGASIDFARIKNLLKEIKNEQVQAKTRMTEQEG